MRKLLFLFILALGVGVNAQILPSGTIDDAWAYSADSLVAECRVSNGGDTTAYGIFQVKDSLTNAIVWQSDSVFFDTIPGLYAYTLSFDSAGLIGNTAYNMFLNIYNMVGNYTTLPSLFTTPLDPGPPVIVSFDTSAVSVDSINLGITTSTLNSANLSVRWGLQLGSYPNQVGAGVSMINISSANFPIGGLPSSTRIYIRAEISNTDGIDVKTTSFKTSLVQLPIITSSDFLSVTSSGFAAYAVGNFGSETSGTANCYRNGSLVYSGPLADNDTASYIFSGQTPGTTYQICWSFISSYGSDSTCKNITTDTIVPPPPTFPYTLASAHVGSGKVRFITTADTATTLYYRVTVESGCNATNPSIGSFSVPRGIDTFFVQLAGADSLRIQGWLQDNVGDTVSYETLVIDLGPVAAGINLDLSLSGSYFQGNTFTVKTFTVDLFHNESTQVYNLSVELADNTYTVIANPDIIYQDIIEAQQTGMNVTISADFGGARYMRVLAEPLSGLGPCGEGGGISDWEPLPNTATGINNVSDFKTSIYPIPFTGSGVVESEEDGMLQIYDMLGKVVFSQDVIIGKNLLELEIEPGLYFYSITNKAGQKGTGNIIVQ